MRKLTFEPPASRGKFGHSYGGDLYFYDLNTDSKECAGVVSLMGCDGVVFINLLVYGDDRENNLGRGYYINPEAGLFGPTRPSGSDKDYIDKPVYSDTVVETHQQTMKEKDCVIENLRRLLKERDETIRNLVNGNKGA